MNWGFSLLELQNPDMKTIFILAGEASGDALGGRLMQALQRQTNGEVKFTGVGGELMQAAGLNSLYPMSDLSVMGIFEVIKVLPRLLKRLKQTKQHILATRPDIIITVDLPDFSFRLAKQLRGSGIPHIHYTPPTVWAWRPGRARKIAPLLDHLLAILPFEPPYFEKYGLPTTFVGHYVTETGIDSIDRHLFRKAQNIPEHVPLLCVLPGSRQQEITTLLPLFDKAVHQLQQRHPYLHIVVPTTLSLHKQVQEQVSKWKIPHTIVHDTTEKYAAMRASNAALAASGTVNLELAMARTPFVIAYKVSRITGWLAKRLIHVKYAVMVNIIKNKLIVPELLQEECNAENMVHELDLLLNSSEARQRQIEAFEDVTKSLQVDSIAPSEKAAEVVIKKLFS